MMQRQTLSFYGVLLSIALLALHLTYPLCCRLFGHVETARESFFCAPGHVLSPQAQAASAQWEQFLTSPAQSFCTIWLVGLILIVAALGFSLTSFLNLAHLKYKSAP